jgi:hypothetical protein
MRTDCDIFECGSPAVDYIERPSGERLYLCAEHYDQLTTLSPTPEDMGLHVDAAREEHS